MISYRQLLSSLVASAFLATGVAHAQNPSTTQPAGGGNKASSEATGGLTDGEKVAIGAVVVGGVVCALACGNKGSGSGTTGTTGTN